MFKSVGEVLKSLPLNNPYPSSSRTLAINNKREITRGGGGEKEVQGETRGGIRSKVNVMYLFARCFQCGGPNWLALDRNKVRPYSKCQACGEIVPTESMIMVSEDYDPKGVPLLERRMSMLDIYNARR